MSERLVDRIPFAKIITALAIIFGISLGLCGVTFIISSSGGHGSGFLIGIGILEMFAIGLSIAGLVLACVVWVTVSIFGGSGEKSQSKIFPEAGNNTEIDKDE